MKRPSVYKKTKLHNGIVVATEAIPSAASASVGVWLDVGSRDESPKNNGISHLFEHMVFKGTHSRSGLEIVQKLEASGGQVNAFTTKEQTCFYAKVVEGEVPLAIDVLLDMVLDPVFDEGELIKEREVVIEELKGCDDNPDDRVYDLFGSALFGKHSLGFPIAGTVQTVKGLHRSQLLRHLESVKTALPVYVIASGKVNHEKVVRLVQEISKRYIKGRVKRAPRTRSSKPYKPQQVVENKPIQQVNMILGAPAFSLSDPRCFPLAVLNCIMGEGMSSRLFQVLREDYGYVYNINTFTEALINAGVFGVSFSTEPRHLNSCLESINKEFSRLMSEGLSSEELDFAKKNLMGTFMLEMESSQNRMTFLARSTMYGHRLISRERYLKRIQDISMKEVNEVIKFVFRAKQWGSAAVLPKSRRVQSNLRLNF